MSEASSFLRYQLAIAEKRAAQHMREYASALLENKQIEERLAEIKSQYDPINESLLRLGVDSNMKQLIRNEIEHFCRYVVTGRVDRVRDK